MLHNSKITHKKILKNTKITKTRFLSEKDKMENMDIDANKYVCEHCEWKGKSILQHMKYNQSCQDKTDMVLLRKSVKEKAIQKKRDIMKVTE